MSDRGPWQQHVEGDLRADLHGEILGRPQPHELTGAQRSTYEYIWHYVRKTGTPPSMREIAAATGNPSTSTVAHRLQALESRGWIGKLSHGQPRGITLLVDLED